MKKKRWYRKSRKYLKSRFKKAIRQFYLDFCKISSNQNETEMRYHAPLGCFRVLKKKKKSSITRKLLGKAAEILLNTFFLLTKEAFVCMSLKF